MDWLRNVYRCYFSKPKHLRRLYREIKMHRFSKIVEIGIASPEHTIKLLDVAVQFAHDPVTYAGIDLFEARPQGQFPLPLKSAHQQFAHTNAKIRLIPGNPLVGLSRFANTLVGTDLLLISSEVDADSLTDGWFYVPRMLGESCLVFQEKCSETGRELNLIEHVQINHWAAKSNRGIHRVA